MTVQLILNWKSFAALGVSVIGAILALKVDPKDAKEALNHGVDALAPCIAKLGDN